MTKRILVTFASQTGFTQGVAEVIGETIADKNMLVDILPMQDVSDLSMYQAVIAGSAIQAGEWLPEAMDFIRKNREELNKKPFAAYLVCMTLAMKNGNKHLEHIQEWMKPVKVLVPTISENMFAGGLDIKKLASVGNRMKFRLSTLFGVWQEGDHRDWDSIRDWAKELKKLFERS